MSGTGAYIEISEDLSKLQCRCEETQKVVDAKVDLRRFKKGWHHVTVMCNNEHSGCEGSIKFFIDGKMQCDE